MTFNRLYGVIFQKIVLFLTVIFVDGFQLHKLYSDGHSGRALCGTKCARPLNTGIVGSIPIQGMDVCPYFFCVCVGLCKG
jgi:hypothetical protein